MRRVLMTPALVLLLVCTGGLRPAYSQDPPGEYDVKAVFLLNFARFVAWPAEAFAHAHSPIVIGILGDDPFGSAIDEMARGERVGGRSITLKRLRADANATKCHILFIS